jgi:hypothetical protein
MRHIVIAAFAVLALCAPAQAADGGVPSADIGEAHFGGIVEERDVGLVFDYLRDAVSAALEGRDAPPPDALRQRAEAIGEEMKRRGAAAARAVLDAIEQSVREGMREPRRQPTARSSQRI